MTDGTRLGRLMARPWFFTLWTVVATFGCYACMYGFRKPFTAAGFGEPETKAWLVTAQVLGYAVSKFLGIKVIAEMSPASRSRTLLAIIGCAQAMLLVFALAPAPLDAACLFGNGLALGLVFGLVLGFVEGRQLTELFVAGLCASFILADGVAKTIGAALLQRLHGGRDRGGHVGLVSRERGPRARRRAARRGDGRAHRGPGRDPGRGGRA